MYISYLVVGHFYSDSDLLILISVWVVTSWPLPNVFERDIFAAKFCSEDFYTWTPMGFTVLAFRGTSGGRAGMCYVVKTRVLNVRDVEEGYLLSLSGSQLPGESL